MRKMQVELQDTSYNIHIGNNIISNLGEIFSEETRGYRFLVITDKNVAKLYHGDLRQSLGDAIIDSIILEPGEHNKSLATAEKVYKAMISLNCDRDTTILSLGGGVIGDLAGYVASTYMRGINYIQIPTSLLAQVDSSIGGKVAVNYNQIKNIIGSFYHPKKVIIDTDFLITLDKRDVRSGLGEVIKYGLIEDFDFFIWCKDNFEAIMNLQSNVMVALVYRALSIKKKIVELDERDNGLRRILNFGHTIGHGIETLDNFNRFRHGEAVLLGMIYESLLAKELSLIASPYYKQIRSMLGKIIEPVRFSQKEINLIIEGMKHDKKRRDHQHVFILPTGQGCVEVFENINENQILKTLRMDW